MAVSMGALKPLNDAVDGVTVTIDDPELEKRDPAFKLGASVTLMGDQAEAFLRIIAQDISAQICKGNGGHGVSRYGQNLHPVSGRVLGDQKDAVGLSPRSRCFRLCKRFPPVDPHAQNGWLQQRLF